MTATPVDPEYTLEELKDLPVTEVQWEDKTNLDVEICESNIPIGAFFKFVAKINNLYPMVNFHVFLNSVSMITSLLKELNFHSDNVKIVCSQNNDKSNLKKLQEVNPDYVIAQPDSPAKKLNVFPSTSNRIIPIKNQYNRHSNPREHQVSDLGRSSDLLYLRTSFPFM